MNTRNKKRRIKEKTKYWPKFKPPCKESNKKYFKRIAQEGLKDKYSLEYAEEFNKPFAERVKKRAKTEQRIICASGYLDYFLIIHDIFCFAKDAGIDLRLGGGNAASSLICHALGFFESEIAPLTHGLIFERFFNLDRTNAPYISLTVECGRYNELIRYIFIRYDTLDGNCVAKAINEDNESESIAIANRSISHIVLTTIGLNARLSTKRTAWECERAGLLTLDIVYCRALDNIRGTLEQIPRIKLDPFECEIKPDHKSLNYVVCYDSRVLNFLCADNDLSDVYLCESQSMRELLKKTSPQSLEDLTAAVALFKMEKEEFAAEYIKAKNNPEKLEYKHTLLKPILQETYGVIIYQEQLMRILGEIGKLSLRHADAVRIQMAKRKTDKIEKAKRIFIKGAAKNGVPKNIAEEIFDDLNAKNGFLFSKAHTLIATDLLAQTAYLKYYYPDEYKNCLRFLHFNNNFKESYPDWLKDKRTELSMCLKNKGQSKKSKSDIRSRLNKIDNFIKDFKPVCINEGKDLYFGINKTGSFEIINKLECCLSETERTVFNLLSFLTFGDVHQALYHDEYSDYVAALFIENTFERIDKGYDIKPLIETLQKCKRNVVISTDFEWAKKIDKLDEENAFLFLNKTTV